MACVLAVIAICSVLLQLVDAKGCQETGCAKTQYCSWRHDFKCMERLQIGDTLCEEHNSCFSGYCNGESICAEIVNGTIPCSSQNECEDKDFYCDDLGDRICRDKSTLGPDCEYDSDCTTYYCDPKIHKCRKLGKEDHCSDDIDCTSVAFCGGGPAEDQSCERKKYLGEECENSIQCITESCRHGKCTTLLSCNRYFCLPDQYCANRPFKEIEESDEDIPLGDRPNIKCVDHKRIGEACSQRNTGECGLNECLYGVCQPRATQVNALGEACDSSKGHGCIDGAYCEGGFCLSDGSLNVTCTDKGTSPLCSRTYAFCDDTTQHCRPRWSQYESCSADKECLSNRCKDGLCGTKEPNAKGDPCKSEKDCNSGLVCLINPDPSSKIRTCGERIQGARGEQCAKTSDCSAYDHYCYKGDCLDRSEIQGKACEHTAECGDWERRTPSRGTWYLKIGFTCVSKKCQYMNKHDGCINFADRILPFTKCYD